MSRVWSLDIDGEPFISQQSGSRQFRIVFDVQVNPGDSLSLADIGLYNLSKDIEIQQGASIVLRAGKTDRVDTIFTGYVTNRFREREGTEIVTRLLCKSGAPVTDRGSAEGSYGKGVTVVDVIKDLCQSWPRQLDIDESQFADAPVFTSGYVTNGDIPRALDDLAYMFGFDWVNERGRVVVTRHGYKRKTAVTEVNQFTGMVGIPEVTRGPDGLGVFVVHALDPYFRINGRINVQSEFQTYNTGNMFIQEMSGDARANGEYNIFQLRHRGDSHGDQWVTEIDGLRAGTAVETAGAGSLIWGARVDRDFRKKVREVAGNLGFDPTWLMAVISFETGRTFSPSERNPVSGATGLIQFMPKTAIGLGTTTAKLARMTAVEQLDWVEEYYSQPLFKGRIRNLGDCYMAVLWPDSIGKPDSYVMWVAGSIQYNQNSGLDINRNGQITRGEAVSRVNDEVLRGQQYAR